jgi:hypothetical protein
MATVDHTIQFTPQCLQICDFALDLGQMLSGDRVDGLARSVLIVR